MWQLVQPQRVCFHIFFFRMTIFEGSQYCYIIPVWFCSSERLCWRVLRPSACSPRALCGSAPLLPPRPPTLCRGAPPLHPGSPPQGPFSSFPQHLHLLLAQSPLPPALRPPPLPRPLCLGWQSWCRWMKGKKACGAARPGWEPGGWPPWWRTRLLDLGQRGGPSITHSQSGVRSTHSGCIIHSYS